MAVSLAASRPSMVRMTSSPSRARSTKASRSTSAASAGRRLLPDPRRQQLAGRAAEEGAGGVRARDPHRRTAGGHGRGRAAESWGGVAVPRGRL